MIGNKKELNTDIILDFFKNDLIGTQIVFVFELILMLVPVILLFPVFGLVPSGSQITSSFFKWFMLLIFLLIFILGILMVIHGSQDLLVIKNKIKTVKAGEYKLEKDYLKKKYIKNGRMCGELESHNIIYFSDEDEYNQAKASVDGKSASIMYRLVCKGFSGPTFPAFKYELSDECKEKVCDFSFDIPELP